MSKTYASWWRSIITTMVLLAGCGPSVSPVDDGEPDGSEEDGPGSTGSSTPATSTSTSTTTTTTSSSTTTATGTDGTTSPTPDSGDSLDGGSFLDGADVFMEEWCDPWLQDCPEGEKCVPFAADGLDQWNALKCTPIVPEAGQPGDACMVAGSPTTGIDTCGLGAICWDVDPRTLEGTCVAQCSGTPELSLCRNPDTTCVTVVEGIMDLCLQICQPLLQDCPAGQGCDAWGELLACFPLPAGGGQLLGDPCEGPGECAPGLTCVEPAGVPGCMGALGCCTSWCDISEPSPGCPPEQTCEAFFEEGMSPGIQYEGVCTVP